MSEQPASEPVLMFRGKPVADRKDCEESIAQRARERGITPDEAWHAIQIETLEFLEASANAQKTKQRTGPATSGFGTSPQSPAKRLNPIAVLNHLEGMDGCDGISELSDEMLPDYLRDDGSSVLEQIESGTFHLQGQHPLNSILRSTLIDGEEGGLARAEIEARLNEAQPMQLSLLIPGKQAVRVMPSDFSKTSLFHATSNNVPRRYCRNEKLGQVGNQVTIFYQGEELRQTDEAIFRELIYQARGKAPWDWIELDTCCFRDAKGAPIRLSGDQYKEIHNILLRMRSGLLLIKSNKRRAFITCNLLQDYEGHGDTKRVRIDPRLVLLFDSYAALDEVVLHSLSGLPQKLYEYIAGIPHNILHPINLTNLFELCYGRIEYVTAAYLKQNPDKTQKQGERATDKKYSDFIRSNLPKALDVLRDKMGVIVSYDINYSKEHVCVVKNLHNTIEAKEFSFEN